MNPAPPVTRIRIRTLPKGDTKLARFVEPTSDPESSLRESTGALRKQPVDEAANHGSEHRREYPRTPRGQRLLADAVERAIQLEEFADDIAVRDPIPAW